MIDEKRNSPQWDHMKQTDKSERMVIASRTSRNQQKRELAKEKELSGKGKIWVQIRLFPIWLRIVLVLLLVTGAAIAGAMFGYGYIGDGNPADALKKDTWIHIINIINGKES